MTFKLDRFLIVWNVEVPHFKQPAWVLLSGTRSRGCVRMLGLSNVSQAFHGPDFTTMKS
jgi:hypothetical protein